MRAVSLSSARPRGWRVLATFRGAASFCSGISANYCLIPFDLVVSRGFQLGLWGRRGSGRKDGYAALNSRPTSMDEVERKREIAGGGAMDTSDTLAGKRNRALADAAKTSEERIGCT